MARRASNDQAGMVPAVKPVIKTTSMAAAMQEKCIEIAYTCIEAESNEQDMAKAIKASMETNFTGVYVPALLHSCCLPRANLPHVASVPCATLYFSNTFLAQVACVCGAKLRLLCHARRVQVRVFLHWTSGHLHLLHQLVQAAARFYMLIRVRIDSSSLDFMRLLNFTQDFFMCACAAVGSCTFGCWTLDFMLLHVCLLCLIQLLYVYQFVFVFEPGRRLQAAVLSRVPRC